MKKIHYVDSKAITNKRILVRCDFDVSLDQNYTIADDIRIRQNIPTLKLLLGNGNKIICIAKLDRPIQRDQKHSLKVVVERLREYLPDISVRLIPDFLSEKKETWAKQTQKELFVLENIRFYPEEKKNDMEFAKRLAELGDIYVNDAFAMCHRAETSIVSLPLLLPSFGGLLLKKELSMIDTAIKKPKAPFVAIIGGAKISTKITLINKLIEIADYVLLCGGLANVFFRAQRYFIGKSLCEYEMVQKARQLLFLAAQKKTAIILPTDMLVGDPKNTIQSGSICRINENMIPRGKAILDIGPETKALFGSIINKGRTIVWNGPAGLFENPAYRQGTDFIYYAIAHNTDAVSIVGGGDTLSAISHTEYLDTITHVSTGGGSMLEYIENGTLPGIDALER